jgi:hypothetical protein
LEMCFPVQQLFLPKIKQSKLKIFKLIVRSSTFIKCKSREKSERPNDIMTWRHKETYRITERQINRKTERQKNIITWKDIQSEIKRQKDRQTERQKTKNKCNKH